MLSGPPFRLAFVFKINSLILSSFPFTSFHLVKTSRSAFSWLYAILCVKLSKNITKWLLFVIIQVFRAHFAINLFHLRRNEIKNKKNTKSRHIQIDHLFNLAYKQCSGIVIYIYIYNITSNLDSISFVPYPPPPPPPLKADVICVSPLMPIRNITLISEFEPVKAES